MFEPLYVAATGLNAFENEMTDITNNLANASTIAFKKGRTEKESLFTIERTFQTELRDQMLKQGITPPFPSIDYGTGVRIAATSRDFSQGTIETTNSPLDLAIQGEGFFQFRSPDGTFAYSRAGNFHVDNEGNIVDPNGHKLEPQIVVPSGTTSITIKQDGTDRSPINNSVDQQDIGQISLARFYNPAGLKSLGQNLYVETPSSGEAMIGSPIRKATGLSPGRTGTIERRRDIGNDEDANGTEGF